MATYVAEPDVMNPNDTKIILPNSVSTFFIDGKPALINGLKNWEIIFLD